MKRMKLNVILFLKTVRTPKCFDVARFPVFIRLSLDLLHIAANSAFEVFLQGFVFHEITPAGLQPHHSYQQPGLVQNRHCLY